MTGLAFVVPKGFAKLALSFCTVVSGMSFSVRVVDQDGDAKEDVEVMAFFTLMGGSLTEYTASDGWAEFDTVGDYNWVQLYVDGHEEGTFELKDGDTFSFTLTE
jgi:hypothetical protein